MPIETACPTLYVLSNNLDPLNGAGGTLDAASDGLSNVEEYQVGAKLNDPDSDDDGTTDGEEVTLGRNPLVDERAVITITNSILLVDNRTGVAI